MSAASRTREILEDLLKKYEMLSRKLDSGFSKLSANQLVRQVDALTRLAKLILSYRSVLDLEERELELTKILSELRDELESDKRAMIVKRGGGKPLECSKLLEKALSEFRRLKLLIAGGGEYE